MSDLLNGASTGSNDADNGQCYWTVSDKLTGSVASDWTAGGAPKGGSDINAESALRTTCQSERRTSLSGVSAVS